jgi:hypothetical protein
VKPLSFFQDLKTKIVKRATVINLLQKQSSNLNKGFIFSYKMFLLITKNEKSYSIRETLILPAVKEIVGTMQGKGSSNKIMKSFPWSNDNVSRRIDEMTDNVKNKLINCSRENNFALYVDELNVTDYST